MGILGFRRLLPPIGLGAAVMIVGLGVSGLSADAATLGCNGAAKTASFGICSGNDPEKKIDEQVGITGLDLRGRKDGIGKELPKRVDPFEKFRKNGGSEHTGHDRTPPKTGGPSPAPVPLPAAGLLLLGGLAGLGALARRRKAA